MAATERTPPPVKAEAASAAAPAVHRLARNQAARHKEALEIPASAAVVRLTAVTGTKDPGLFASEHWGDEQLSPARFPMANISRSSTSRRTTKVLPARASVFFPSMSRGMNSRTSTSG